MKYLKLKFLLMFFALAMAIPPAWAETVIDFKETFDQCDGIGGNDGTWGSITSTAVITADNEGWQQADGNGASKCTRFGTGKRQGSATTPSISVSSGTTYTLTFKAGAWTGDATTLKLEATGGSLSQTSVTMINGAWTEYSLTFYANSNSATIKFKGNAASNARFFLDEVMLSHDSNGGGDNPDPPTPTSTIYEKVTDVSQMEVGKNYIFVYGNVALGALTNSGGGYGTDVQVTVNSDGTVKVDNTNALELTLGIISANRYTFKTQNGNFLTATNNTSLYTNSTSDANGWNLYAADGGYGVTSQASGDSRGIIHRDGNSFRHYATSNATNSGYGWAKLYVESSGSTTERVATPTFTPAGDAYDTPQNVTISCETPNSTIYYTTDGSTPDENSTLYNGAITVDHTMTIKAIAVASGMDNSYVASATYTLPEFVTNLTDANALGTNVSFKYNGYAEVTYVNGTDAWIRDDDGKGGYLYRALSRASFDNGDVLKAGWTATKDEFHGLDEFKDVSGLEKNGAVTVEPEVLTQITDADVNKYVKLVNVSESEIVDGSGNAVQLYNKFGTNYTFESGKKYDVVGIVGYFDKLQLHIISITEHGEPTIEVNPTALTLKEDAQTFTVTGENLVDNVGVPNVNHVFNTTYSGDVDWGFVKDAQGKVNGTVTVSYTGRNLKATDTFVAGTKKSWNPEVEISIPVTVTYQPDIYIVGNINNAGWNFGDGNRPMSYDEATGLYTAQLTTTDHSFFMFARKPGQNYGWQGDKNRLFFGAQTNGGNWVLGNDPTGNIDVEGNTGNQYHPIELPSAGEYTITINPTDKKFTITKVVHQVETPVISPEGGNYNTIQTVTITAAEGATIHYTTDGSDPTESSTLYEGPITVDKTTTIKAIAVMDGMDNSEVAEATYTLPTSVNTLAAANDLDAGIEFLFTGDAVVTYANGDYTYLRDVNATAGGGLIYQSGINLAQGVVLKKGWDAKRADYRGLKEYINAINVESSGNTADFTPFDRTGVTLDDANMNEYIKLNNVKITGKTLDEGSSKYTYTATYGENREVVTYLLHNQFDVEGILEGKTYNVTGTVIKYNNDMEVYPTAIEIVKQDPGLAFAQDPVNIPYGAEFTGQTLIKPDDLNATVNYASNNEAVATVDADGIVTIHGVGNAKITASVAESDYYLAGNASYNIVVAQGDVVVEYSAETATATVGVEPENLPTLTVTPAGLEINYSSSNQNVATIDADGKVTIKGAGETIIKAEFAGNTNYNAAEDSYTLTVGKGNAVVEYSAETGTATVGVEPENLPTLTVTPAGLEINYSSSNQNVATIDADGKVTIKGAGETIIKAEFAGNTNYNAAEDSYTLTVGKGDAVVEYSAETGTATFGVEPENLPTLTVTPAGLEINYSSSNQNVATIDADGKVTIKGAGETIIKAEFAGNTNYNAAEDSYTLTVNKADLEVSFNNETPDPITIGDSFTAPVLSEVPEGTTVTYKSSNPAVATVDPATGVVTIVGPGTAKITATVTGANYNETSASYTITVNDVVEAIAAPTFSPAAGTYTEPKEVAIACATPGVTIEYKIGEGAYQPYTKPFTVGNENGNSTVTVTARAKMGNRTVYTPATAEATYTINVLPAATITDGYYNLINNALSGKYANVAGRRTLNFVADADNQAGTVFRIETNNKGQVQTLRSQACDIQDYAKRAMNYVPTLVQVVINKLNDMTDVADATGTGTILGENGLKALMDKFNECFDYNLYVEGGENAYRIYARTPSMQNVVDFYAEHKAQVDEKLPMLEGYINQVLAKIRSKVPAGMNANVFEPFSLLTVWEEMGGQLIKPVKGENDDITAIMAFYEQVLTNKEYVWNFAYTTAKHYLDNIKDTQTYRSLVAQHPDIDIYVGKMEEIRPETKFFIIQNGNEPDYVGETHSYIKENLPMTYWTLNEREKFTVNVPEANKLNDSYYTTLYTDFGYELPEGVEAYAVTGIDANDVAQLTKITSAIPAQTPVLLKATAAGNKELTLKMDSRGGAVEGNLLEGPDYLIKEYGINSPTVEMLFTFAEPIVPADMLEEYAYLKLRTSGTVNNKYFWNVNDALDSCTYKNANNEDDCVVRSLAVKNGTLAFSEHWTTENNKAFLVSDTKPVIYLEKETLAEPTFSPVPGSYTVNNGESVTITITAEDDATIYYKTGDGEYQLYNGPITASDDMTIVAKAEKDGMIASDEVTAVYVIDNPTVLPDVDIEPGYYQIKNLGNNKYANVAGRKTLNFKSEDEAKTEAGTVIWLETNDKGQVQSIRSQAADLQRYADRAMSYVPDIVNIVVNKINEMNGIEDATGAGSVLGENGLGLIMEEFKKSFDHHLYVEQAEGGYRLYGKTPSMQPVVEFYREHTAQVEAKLLKLEDFINDALTILKNKIGNSNVFSEFKLHDIWQKMGGTLTEPTDDASTMAFYREVLNNKNYVWDFAYQTAMTYLNYIKDTQTYKDLVNEHPEILQYIDKIDQIRPDFKYYIVQKDDKPDFISEGNVDIINNEGRTIWTLVPCSTFDVKIDNNQFGCPYVGGVGGYATTLYTDFAYNVPDGVTAYKVTSIEGGKATIEALSGIIPAQTPVLLTAKVAGTVTLKLTTEPATADTTGNLLRGPDYLINVYDLKTDQVQSLFDQIKQKLGQDFYDTYVAQYEYLADLNSGTVNNKYFWGLKESDVEKCSNDGGEDCVVRNLSGDKFIDNWKVETNKAFLVTDEYNEITFNTLHGDVNHDGLVNIEDVTDLIDRLLGMPDPYHLKACEYCSDVNKNGTVKIDDVTTLIDILLGIDGSNQATEPEGGE